MSGFILNWKTYQCLFIPWWNYKPQKTSKLLASDIKANNSNICSFQKTNLQLVILDSSHSYFVSYCSSYLVMLQSVLQSGQSFPFYLTSQLFPLEKQHSNFSCYIMHKIMLLFLTLIASSLPTPRGQTDSEFSYTTLKIQHWIPSLQGYPEMSRVLLQSITFEFQNYTIEVGDTRFFGSIPIPSSLGISISMVENTYLLSYIAHACMNVFNTLSNE